MQRYLHVYSAGCLFFVALMPIVARAEITYSDVPGDLSSTVIKLTVTPAAEPVQPIRSMRRAYSLDPRICDPRVATVPSAASRLPMTSM